MEEETRIPIRMREGSLYGGGRGSQYGRGRMISLCGEPKMEEERGS
jgi:hypothetical protein